MRMPMVDVRVVGMLMGQHVMAVLMRVRLVPVPGEGVLMLMMLVVPVAVAVFERLVGVVMLMPLPQVQPYTRTH